MAQRALLLAAAAAVAAAQTPYVLETIAALDCNGGLHLLPGELEWRYISRAQRKWPCIRLSSHLTLPLGCALQAIPWR